MQRHRTLHWLPGGLLLGGLLLAAVYAMTPLGVSTQYSRAVTVAGGLAGAGVHAALYAWLLPLLLEPLSFGKPTLHSWLGLPLGGVMFWVAYRWWSREHVSRAVERMEEARAEADPRDATPGARA
jgi:hypothetical protein